MAESFEGDLSLLRKKHIRFLNWLPIIVLQRYDDENFFETRDDGDSL